MARGGGKGRSSGTMSRDVLVSKKLSWLLRHGAEKEGLKLGKGGFANLADVLANRNLKSIGVPSLSEIQTLVAENDKQRYTLIHASQYSHLDTSIDALSASTPASPAPENDDDPRNYFIRANQGHSLKIEDEGLLTPITLEKNNLPSMVVHGTRREYWPRILTSGGLKPMGRNHVHFATGLPASLQSSTASTSDLSSPNAAIADAPQEETTVPTTAVVSGMRATSTVLIFVNLRLALEKGLKFWLSDNGVVLSEGDEHGLVGVELFSKVEEKGGRILVKDGEVVGELGVEPSKQRAGGKSGGRGSDRGGQGQRKPQLNNTDIL